MARTRTFNHDNVLLAAANVFRQRGYRDASIAELERETGLVSGSIYNAFGDKAGFFRAALHHYVHAFVRQRLDTFAGPDAKLEDLEQLFVSVLEGPLADGFGCLANNSIVEFGKGGELAAAEISETLAIVRGGIAGVLQRELGAEALETRTMHLLVLYHGILTLSRGPTSLTEMIAVVRAAFSHLRQLRDGPQRAPKRRKST